MARKLKVSTIGAEALSAPAGTDHTTLIRDAITTWQSRFDQVLPDRPDLIVVPEMCDSYAQLTGEAANDYHDARGDKVLEFFADTAKRNNCYLTYPAIRRAADGRIFNSVRLLDREGQIAGTYDKNHVVICETTEGGVLCGSEAPIIEADFGRVAFAICFDLNFDALRQQYVEVSPDLIIFPSMFHGGFMQQHWAYSCRAFFISSISIPALPSGIISPVGEVIATTTCYFDYVTSTINLDCRVAHLDENQQRLRDLKKLYGPDVTIHDPGHDMGSVLVTSESEAVSVAEMVEAVGLELLDDYLNRSLEHHRTTGSSR